MPARFSPRSSTPPAGPTNGRPSRSSRSPGVSPTSISSACLGPSPITACVAASHRSQARHSWTDLRRLVREGGGGTGAGGYSACTAVILSGPYPGDEAGTHRLLGLDVRRLAWGPLPRARSEAALARDLRIGVRHRRGEFHVLPPRAPRRGRRLGRAAPARVPVCGQGEPVPDPRQAAGRHRRRDRALLRAAVTHDRRRQARAGAVAAARELPSRRRPPAWLARAAGWAGPN